ncbi:uncharacterized protein [Cherax quadricarinatus]
MVTFALLTTAQSLQITPSFGTSGGITFPLFSPSLLYDQKSAASSTAMEVAVPAPDQARRRSSYRSADTGQIKKASDFSGISTGFSPIEYPEFITNSTKFDQASQKTFFGTEEESSSYAYPETSSRNNSNRFFNFYSDSQTFDLGISFTVPFLSIPTSSLMNLKDSLGSTTGTALSSLMSINWPSVISIGAAVLLAALLLPQLASLLTNLVSGSTEYNTPYTGSYGRNIERGGVLPVAPFTSLLHQLDDALAQYDLDSTSCMQRAACNYVAESEASVKEGDADSIEMIVSGIARNKWLQTLVGKTFLTEAVETGRSGDNCQLQYPKCPFSLTGVLRFLATYASLAT